MKAESDRRFKYRTAARPPELNAEYRGHKTYGKGREGSRSRPVLGAKGGSMLY